MPKLKTHRGLAKRFKKTKSGKFKRLKAGRGHLLAKKSRKKKRQSRKAGIVAGTDEKALRLLLPY